MTVHFSKNGLICGCAITAYLLEKNRVVRHATGERSYHSLYQMVAGATEKERAMWSLTDSALDYHSLAMGQATALEGVDDAQGYRDVRRAMCVVGMSVEEQEQVYRVCAGILHLLNAGFSVKDNDVSTMEGQNLQCLETAAKLWEVDPQVLLECLTKKKTSLFTKNLTPAQAADNRDALCKALYSGVFNHLIGKVNAMFMGNGAGGASKESFGLAGLRWVGLLDIFGFEQFETNSFEQLCINLTNERLQMHYTDCIFRRDIEEYAAEGIDLEGITFADNQPTVDLLMAKGGVFQLLDDECINLSGTDDNLLQHMATKMTPHAAFSKPKAFKEGFAIRHYAATVKYTIAGFREKNMDAVEETMQEAMRTSTCAFTRGLLAPALPTSPPLSPLGNPAPSSSRKGKKKRTVGGSFCESLQALLARITTTNPHWIRCIKPHHNRQRRHFQGQEIMTQLACAGVLDTIRIRQSGYTVRMPHAQFGQRYQSLVLRLAGGGPGEGALEACRRIARVALQDRDCRIGKTKVFLKDEAYNALEKARTQRLSVSALRVQAFARAAAVRAAVTHPRYLRRCVLRLQTAARAALAVRGRTHARRVRRATVVVQAAARALQSARIRMDRKAWARTLALAQTVEAQARQTVEKEEGRQLAQLQRMHRRGGLLMRVARWRGRSVLADMLIGLCVGDVGYRQVTFLLFGGTFCAAVFQTFVGGRRR